MNTISITDLQAGQRLDKFLVQEIFNDGEVTRGDIERRIRLGKISVNGKKAKPSYLLKTGDEIEAEDPAQAVTVLVPNPKIKINIVTDNDNFLVIDKPAGLQVHPDAHEKLETVANWLIEKYPDVSEVHDGSRDAHWRPGIVHRLDKETSGLLVLAKNQPAFNALKKMFQEGKMAKTYLAIVYGQLAENSGNIDKPIAKAADYRRQVIASNRTRTKARSAVTGYTVVKGFQEYSLIEATPKTGRTHQIRVHLWSIGHPIVGDALYKPKNAKELPIKAKRQLLHAARLSFQLDGQAYEFDSRPPSDFMSFVFGK